MALQGTIDTFELTEVVRLLAAGSKTGVLRLEGSRGSGRVWVDEGKVTTITVDHAPRAESLAEAMFELLRFEDGHFTFASDELANPAGEPTELDGILVDAEAQLAEWREIEVVVPTTRALVTLRQELTRADVVLDKQRWRLVAAIAGGITVATLGDAMDLGELPVSRAVKDLIELGVVDLDITVADDPVDEAVADEPVGFDEPFAEPAVLAQPAFGTEPADVPPVFIGTDPVLSIPDEETNAARAQLDEFAAGFGLSDPAIYESSAVDASPNGADGSFADGSTEYDALADFSVGVESDGGFARAQSEASPTPEPAEASPILGASNDAAEVARQLSNLSPAAARAVAAAAKATTDEEREAALAAVAQEGDEPIDRELLLRFLASVKS
ncbi:MAG TPA: DUF4388 domain-containing protein [Acidimicrobiales bacterium]